VVRSPTTVVTSRIRSPSAVDRIRRFYSAEPRRFGSASRRAAR
jgi:hypothetical protein